MQQSSDPAPVVGDWVFSQTIGGDEAAYFIKSVAPGGRFLQIYCVGGKYFLRVFPWPAKGPAGAMRATIGVDRDFTAGQGIGLGGQIDAERGSLRSGTFGGRASRHCGRAEHDFCCWGGARLALRISAQRMGAALKALAAASE